MSMRVLASQSYTFWREIYVRCRIVQGRLNDLGLLLAGALCTLGAVAVSVSIPARSAALLKAASNGALTLHGVLQVLELAALDLLRQPRAEVQAPLVRDGVLLLADGAVK